MVREGRQVARSYRGESYAATWLVGPGIVEFYDSQGQMRRRINLFESLVGQRIAA